MERLLRQSPRAARSKAEDRLVGFIPSHGGAGASTVAMHVAASISRESAQSVLLVDWDFHCGTIQFRLGLKPDYTLADALERSDCLDELWTRLTTRWKGGEVLVPPRQASLSPDQLQRGPALFRSAR